MPASESHSKITTIIPVHDRQALLTRALRSVLAQSLAPAEILVVDDGSTDRPEEAVAALGDSRIRVIRHERRRGAAAARNSGIRAARENLFAFLDSDDEWHPDKLARQVELLERAPSSVQVVTCGYTKIERRPDGAERRVSRVPAGGRSPKRMLWLSDLAPGSTILARREAFDEVGLYDESLPRLEDRDWLLRYLRKAEFRVAPEILATLHVASRAPFADVAAGARALRKRQGPFVRSLGLAASLRFRSSLRLEVAAAAYYHKRTPAFLGNFLAAFALWPFQGAGFYRRLAGRVRFDVFRGRRNGRP